jgi:hypothetical protein
MKKFLINKKVMIANLSSDGDNIEETISTARFA